MTSLLAIMPRSPWLASPGCTNSAGVPVDAKVAAILRPTWPDLPMPVTITRPCAARIKSMAAMKPAPMRSRIAAASASTPLASASSVRKAESMAACARSLFTSAGLNLAIGASRSFINRRFNSTELAARQAGGGANVNGGAARPLTNFRAPEYVAHGRQNGRDRDVVGAAVGDCVVAFEPSALRRRLVAGRLQDGG